MSADRFILLVEDCEDAVPALQIALESHFQCAVKHESTVERAVAVLAHSRQPLLAIITDLNLPGTNGYELIDMIRRDVRWARTPIIMISADAHPRTPVHARDRGADAFFSKPFSPAGICQSLERILNAKNEMLSVDSSSRDSEGSGRG